MSLSMYVRVSVCLSVVIVFNLENLNHMKEDVLKKDAVKKGSKKTYPNPMSNDVAKKDLVKKDLTKKDSINPYFHDTIRAKCVFFSGANFSLGFLSVHSK